MNKYLSIIFSAIFFLIVFNPCQLLATSITETKSEIGFQCTASGNGSIAMGHSTTASGFGSTAMGYSTTAGGDTSTAMGRGTSASGNYSTATGYYTTAGGDFSWAGGRSMRLTDTAISTFAWGYAITAESISTPNAFLIFPAGTAGKVGIGTRSPKCLIDARNESPSFNSGDISNLQFLVANNAASVLGGKAAIGFSVSSAIDSDNIFGAMITHTPEDQYSNGGLEFWTKDTNTETMTLTEKMRIDSDGKVGIGTDDPQYKLDVIGSARVTGNIYYGGSSGSIGAAAYNKPDYVFEEGYKVMSTEQVAKHLEQENSLPWITSLKQEKEENGALVDMTRMSFETVETVENLQIQIIELSKLIKALKPENDALKAENAMLKKDIEKIKAILGI